MTTPFEQETELVRFDPKSEVGNSDLSSVLSVRTWGELKDLPPLLPTAPNMTPDLLPESFRPWIADIAARLQLPLECIAIPAMIAVAGVVGRSVGIGGLSSLLLAERSKDGSLQYVGKVGTA